MTFFNKLTASKLERLALLLEEMGKAQQAIGEVLRHGYNSEWDNTSNVEMLERELGDVCAAIDLLFEAKDITSENVEKWMALKIDKYKAKEFLHHQ